MCTSPSTTTPGAGDRKGKASLDVKLTVFDANAEDAVDYLIDWLGDHRGDLIAVARGRHVTGHYVHGDKNFLEWSDGVLLANAAEELADALVYVSRFLHRTA